MKRTATALTLVFVFLAAANAFAILPVKAEPKTITVPEDYQTIQEAIANALNGDTILVQSGTYQENPINTTKSISIMGEGSQSTYLNINCPAFEGKVYGFNITTFGRAIDINADNFQLSGFNIITNGGDISFSGNDSTISNNRFGAPFTAKGRYLDIINNTFDYAIFASGFGVNFNYPFEVTLTLSRFSENSILYGKYGNFPVTFNGKYNLITNNKISGAGVYIVCTPCFLSGNELSNSLDFVTIVSSNSTITKNTIDRVDYGFGNEGSNNIIFANQITNCGKAYADPSKVFWPKATFPGNESGLIFGNNFINNFRNLECSKMPKIDAFDNGTLGNYWSDYAGADANSDGIGDTPYVIDANRTDFNPSIVAFDISKAPDLKPYWAKNIANTMLATTNNGSTVALTLDGNVTRSSLSEVSITANQSVETTSVSFTVTGDEGNTGFCNMTFPKSTIPYGTTPKIEIDDQPASDQGFTQDNGAYYVWYTTVFGTHQVSIIFGAGTQPELVYDIALLGIAAVAIFAVVLASIFLLIRKRRKEAHQS